MALNSGWWTSTLVAIVGSMASKGLLRAGRLARGDGPGMVTDLCLSWQVADVCKWRSSGMRPSGGRRYQRGQGRLGKVP